MRKILSAALALVCIWFASPALAVCENLYKTQNGTSAYLSTDCSAAGYSSYLTTDFIPIEANTTYTFYSELTTTLSGHAMRICFYDSDKNTVGNRGGGDVSAVGHYAFTHTSPSNAAYIRVSSYQPGVALINPIIIKGDYSGHEAYDQCYGKIQIATTKYNESAFGPLNTALANAISVVDSVVSNTITQAASIATLQAQKQTRPNDIADDSEKCPAGKKCLLVTDENKTPHWYEIFDPIHWFLDAFFVKNPNGQYEENVKDFRRWQGNSYFRKTYIDGSASVYVRQWTAATPARTVGGMYQTLSEGDSENAGTWAVEYDGTEAEGINAGVMYGIAKCTSVAGTFANKLPAASEAKFYELPAPVGQAEREGYERENFKQCWCKMTAVGVPGDDGDPANGAVYPVGSSSWVFANSNGSAAYCASSCATYCANDVRNNAGFRAVLFGM